MQKKILFALAVVAAVVSLNFSKKPKKTESPIDVYQRSWEKKAQGLQRKLEANLPLKDSTILHTHNTYNSSAYTTAFSYIDPNQNYSINDQLRMDIRAIELDVHWYFSMEGWPWEWGNSLLLCHGGQGGNEHLGCSTYDRKLTKGLDELNSFIRANRSEVVILYIEDHMDGRHDKALDAMKGRFGDLIYRPSGNCQDAPVNVTRQQVLDAGKNIIVWSGGCGTGEWQGWVYNKNNLTSEENSSKFTNYPTCGMPTMSADAYANKITRFYEDKTNLTAWFGGGSGSTTAKNIPEMMKCGVNLIGMDKLTPTDGRLYAASYSWAAGEPNNYGGNEHCAVQGSNGRWNDVNCNNKYRFACRNSLGQWRVTSASGSFDQGASICNSETGGGSSFTVPRNGEQNQKLVEAKQTAGAGDVWIRYSDRSGNWAE